MCPVGKLAGVVGVLGVGREGIRNAIFPEMLRAGGVTSLVYRCIIKANALWKVKCQTHVL